MCPIIPTAGAPALGRSRLSRYEAMVRFICLHAILAVGSRFG